MSRSNPARWLAPLALAAAVAALLMTVTSSGGDASAGGGTAAAPVVADAPEITATSATAATSEGEQERARVYVVKPGDVLSAIAEATGVPLEEIERLNPGVDAQSLRAGQRIKLAP